jgi:hypothetical protein
MQKAGEPYGAGVNILLRWPYVVRTFERTVTVFGYSFSLEVLAAGLRAGRICLRTLPVFPASGFKELPAHHRGFHCHVNFHHSCQNPDVNTHQQIYNNAVLIWLMSKDSFFLHYLYLHPRPEAITN